MYDKDNKEYFAIPVEVAEERGIQRAESDIEVVVKVDDQDVKFLAIPFETARVRGIEIPEIDIVDHDIPIGLLGKDFITKQFVKVKWHKLNDKLNDEYTKKYDIREHIVVAGCKHSDALKNKEFDELEGKEKLHCTEKEVFSVLHPIDEFLNQHIMEIEQT
jgi:hypothetical protein